MTTKLSPQQTEEFKLAFKMMDVNGDGLITPWELKKIMKEFSFNPSEQEIEAIIKQIDTDGNGSIELNEFLAFFETQLTEKYDEKEELQQLFKLFDRDGNGQISKQELKEGLEKLGERMTEQEVQQLIEAADIDGDGQINYEEFVQLMKFK